MIGYRPSMIGVGVGDERRVSALHRIDDKVTCGAVKTGIRCPDQLIDRVFGMSCHACKLF